MSLRVGIPHYLMNAEHPQAVQALVRHLSHVLDVPNTTDLSDQIDGWRDVHDELADLVAEPAQLVAAEPLQVGRAANPWQHGRQRSGILPGFLRPAA